MVKERAAREYPAAWGEVWGFVASRGRRRERCASDGQYAILAAGARPVHCLWSDSLARHFCMVNGTETEMLVETFANVWKYEGIAWYAPRPSRLGRKEPADNQVAARE